MLQTEPHLLTLDLLLFSRMLPWLSQGGPQRVGISWPLILCIDSLVRALFLVLDGWALSENGTLVCTSIVFPLRKPNCFVCMVELGRVRKGGQTLSPLCLLGSKAACVCLDFLKLFLQLRAPFLFFFSDSKLVLCNGFEVRVQRTLPHLAFPSLLQGTPWQH